jgi:uncharacterized protein (DUF1778 family)
MGKPKTAKQSTRNAAANVTFRCHPLDKDAIVRAAQKAGKSDSEYCRDVMIDYAYSDLNERRPNLPPVGRDVRRRMIEEAAKARGLTVRKYMLELAQAQAAVDLGFDTVEGPPIQARPATERRPVRAPPPLLRPEPTTAVSRQPRPRRRS